MGAPPVGQEPVPPASAPQRLETTVAAVTARHRREAKARKGGRGTGVLTKGENLFGWLFVSPALTILLLFLVIPIILALYVSFTNWSGLTNPLSSSVKWVGLANYRTLITQPGLDQTDFGTAVRADFFISWCSRSQTALALWLAVLLNNRFLRAKGFFRTAFYFPSVTSSIAITVVFIFLFQGTGVVNTILGWFGVTPPNWLYDTQGVFWTVLEPVRHIERAEGGPTIWCWVSRSGTGCRGRRWGCARRSSWRRRYFGHVHARFLAALQNIADDVDEASTIDGATPWQRFRWVTLPLLRPAVVLVLTLGFISTWQVFDQGLARSAQPHHDHARLFLLPGQLPGQRLRRRCGRGLLALLPDRVLDRPPAPVLVKEDLTQ